MIVFIAAPVLSQQHYLYSPQKIDSDQPGQIGDGILVREMVIRKGDTLSGISKKMNGRGYYYPQILLFNEIKNPHLIHTGKVLRVPVKSVGGNPESTRPDAGAARIKTKRNHSRQLKSNRTAADQTAYKADIRHAVEPAKAVGPPVVRPGGSEPLPPEKQPEHLFDLGLKAYRQGDCRSALEQFDRFLAQSPSSPQAAEASLYKADCYLKFSNQ